MAPATLHRASVNDPSGRVRPGCIPLSSFVTVSGVGSHLLGDTGVYTELADGC